MKSIHFIWLFLIPFLGCKKVNQPIKTIEKVSSDYQSENTIHVKHTFGAINQIETYGMLGKGNSHDFRDSVIFWDRKEPELNDQRMKFEIVVDTTTFLPLELSIDELMYRGDSTNFSVNSSFIRYNSDWAGFNSYPVYLVNIDTTDHIMEFQDGSVYMIYEAQDSLGNWKPIENWVFTHFCGNSYYEMTVKPDYYIVSKVLVHSGDFETNLRLKWRNFDEVMYSQPFRGSISYNQFNDSIFVDYSKEYANIYYDDKPDSIDYFASKYLAEMRLDR